MTQYLSPGLRLFDLLELLVAQQRPLSLAELQSLVPWPKPTLHRMLGQLESGELLQREPDGRRYALAPRALRLAEGALAASSLQGVRRAVLRALVADIGESVNLTAMSGAEVIYLDRVETALPLRMDLRPGTRVPLHASASGKLFLAWLPARQRRGLLDALHLSRHTATTLTTPAALDAELERIRREDFAVDAEEFVEGLACVAVPVRSTERQAVRCAVAVQAPAARMPLQRMLTLVPRLREAAAAVARSL